MSLFNRKKPIRQKLVEHMGKDLNSFPIISEQFEAYNYPNLHLALEDFVKQPGRNAKLVGVQGGFLSFGGGR